MERDNAAFAEGCAAARADVATGSFVYRWSGHAGHWGHWIATQLSVRFGVGLDGLGICLITEAAVSFNDGYNSVLIAEIENRHGRGAFQTLLAEARLQPEESLGDAKRAWLERHPSA